MALVFRVVYGVTDRVPLEQFLETAGYRKWQLLAAVNYVLHQEYPLVFWTARIPELGLAGGRVV